MGRKKGKQKTAQMACYSSPEVVPEIPKTLVEKLPLRFKLEKLLGTGGMCEVYSALDLRRLEWNDKSPLVAVKRLLPKLADNHNAQLALAQEFFTLRHLTHPGVVRVYDLHPESEGLCFSMELLEGSSLHQSLANMPSGYGRDGIWIGEKLFETLSFLHNNGVVHADVKPANLFIAPKMRLVITDFNASHVIVKPGAACSPVSNRLRTAFIVPAHSLLHASPERLKTGQPSLADDIYAACCTIYELIAGMHPFSRLSSLEAEQRRMSPQKPPGISGKQWKALAGGLSFSAEQRPDADQLWQVFKASTKFSRLFTSFA